MLGVDEIIANLEIRDHTLQIVSERAEFMFFSLKDFKERILIPYPSLLKDLQK